MTVTSKSIWTTLVTTAALTFINQTCVAQDLGAALAPSISDGAVAKPSLKPNTVTVTDDLSTYVDLSKSEDLDTQDDRMLVIRWSFAESDYIDFHVYVKSSRGNFTFLGRPGAGDATYLAWAEGADGIFHSDFADGPQFGEFYRFKVYGITTSGNRPFRGPVVTKGAVEYKEQPVELELAPGQVFVTDDLSTTTNLAPTEGGVDADAPDERMLVIRWRADPVWDYKDFHVQVGPSTEGPFQYLGRTKSGEVSLLVWAQGAPNIHGQLRDGPQFGETYAFRVFGMTRKGTPRFFGPWGTAGTVTFEQEEVPEPTPSLPPEPTPEPTATPTGFVPANIKPGNVIVTDDLASVDDLSRSVDYDYADDRMLVIRWQFKESDYEDFHVYVKGREGPYRFLGRPGGKASHLAWVEGSPLITAEFSAGPQFGELYHFKVYGIPAGGKPRFRGPLVTAGPVGFEETTIVLPTATATTVIPTIVEAPVQDVTPLSTPVMQEPIETPTPTPTVEEPVETATPTPTVTPTEEGPPPGEVFVMDDLGSFEDLSGHEDLDEPDERILVIRWNFVSGTFGDIHVYVKPSRGGWAFLGRTGTGEATRLVWAAEAPGIHSLFRSGPQLGESYQFRVYGIMANGKPAPGQPLVTVGPVRFDVQAGEPQGLGDKNDQKNPKDPRETGKPDGSEGKD